MRQRSADAALAPDQEAVADSGLKAMIPVGRPFLDYVLSALADAGYQHVCLVIGPEHAAVREYYTREVEPRRIRVSFAEQAQPLGTADAVLAAEQWVGTTPFIVINADNYYPVSALAALRTAQAPALIGFEAGALVREGNITPERIAAYALLDVAADGTLRRIVEKPGLQATVRLEDGAYVSMTCWLFDAAIFNACRRVERSARGELELPSAIQLLIDDGARFTVLPAQAPVLDLSRRDDIPAVSAQLAGVDVRL